MIFAIVVHSMFLTIFFFQQVTLGIENNWSASQFAILIPFYTFTSIIFTFLTGYIIDKFGVRTVLPYYQIPGVLVFVNDFFKRPNFFVIPFSLLGIMQGISNSLSGTLARIFWNKISWR